MVRAVQRSSTVPEPGTPLRRTRPRRFVPHLQGYARRVFFSDVVVISLVLLGAELLRFRTLNTSLGEDNHLSSVSYTYITIGLGCLWIICLRLTKAYDYRILGFGPLEYSSVAKGTFYAFSVLGLVSYLFALPIARGYVLLGLPLGLGLLVVSRWLWRKYVVRRREAGDLLQTVILVGDIGHVNTLLSTFDRLRSSGYRPFGVCTSGRGSIHGDLEILGAEVDAAQIARAHGVDAVAIAGSGALGSRAARRLAWQLEGTGISLIIVPNIVDVAAPRLVAHTVDGVTLMFVGIPTFDGPQQFVKTASDKLVSGLALIVLSPLLAAIALVIRISDGGPALFVQRRVGRDFTEFNMLKFRTMVPDAEKLRDTVEATAPDNADEPDRGPMFKRFDDPRITRVGKFLRRTSLDELPQLVNILRGDMSLVGPRPPLPREVAAYDEDEGRRMLLRPGLTGLWQVSGRSNLSWEQSIRYDLYYVENWSVTTDIIIMFRTITAVFTGRGAG